MPATAQKICNPLVAGERSGWRSRCRSGSPPRLHHRGFFIGGPSSPVARWLRHQRQPPYWCAESILVHVQIWLFPYRLSLCGSSSPIPRRCSCMTGLLTKVDLCSTGKCCERPSPFVCVTFSEADKLPMPPGRLSRPMKPCTPAGQARR